MIKIDKENQKIIISDGKYTPLEVYRKVMDIIYDNDFEYAHLSVPVAMSHPWKLVIQEGWILEGVEHVDFISVTITPEILGHVRRGY